MYKLVVTFANKDLEFQYVECDHVLLDTRRGAYSVVRGTDIYDVNLKEFMLYSAMEKEKFFEYMRFLLDMGAESRYREMRLGSPTAIVDRLLSSEGETEQSDTK